VFLCETFYELFYYNGFMSIMRTNKAELVLHFPVLHFQSTPAGVRQVSYISGSAWFNGPMTLNKVTTRLTAQHCTVQHCHTVCHTLLYNDSRQWHRHTKPRINCTLWRSSMHN